MHTKFTSLSSKTWNAFQVFSISLKVWNGFQIFTFFVWYLDFIPDFGHRKNGMPSHVGQ